MMVIYFLITGKLILSALSKGIVDCRILHICRLEEQDDSYGRYESMRQLFDSQIQKYSDYISHVRSYDDITACYENHKVTAYYPLKKGESLEAI